MKFKRNLILHHARLCLL